jgi:hypothetical protein
MDATNISPLQRLENAVLRKTVELDIVEGIVWGRNGKGARGELTEEGEEAVVKKVLGAEVEY